MQVLGFFAAQIGSMTDESFMYAGKRPALQAVRIEKNLNALEESLMKIIKIKDYYGNYQEVPVDDALYAEWLELQRESDRIRKREIYHRAWMPIEDAEDTVMTGADEVLEHILQEEKLLRLYEAIKSLTPIQQRRVKMFLDDMNYTEIARAEGKPFSVVYRSLQYAFKHLRTLLQD